MAKKKRRKLSPGRGAQKGAAFERKCCKQLSLWVSDGQRDDVFWRSAMSGGRATLGLRKGIKRDAQAGDMTSISEHLGANRFLKVFVAEFKHRRNLRLESLISKKKSPLLGFWKKHLGECNSFSRLPFMVAKQNLLPTLLILNNAGMVRFGLTSVSKIVMAWAPVSYEGQRCQMYILSWERFLKTIPPLRIKRTHLRG